MRTAILGCGQSARTVRIMRRPAPPRPAPPRPAPPRPAPPLPSPPRPALPCRCAWTSTSPVTTPPPTCPRRHLARARRATAAPPCAASRALCAMQPGLHGTACGMWPGIRAPAAARALWLQRAGCSACTPAARVLLWPKPSAPLGLLASWPGRERGLPVLSGRGRAAALLAQVAQGHLPERPAAPRLPVPLHGRRHCLHAAGWEAGGPYQSVGGCLAFFCPGPSFLCTRLNLQGPRVLWVKH